MKRIFLLSTLCLLAIMSSCRDDNDNDIIGSNNSNVTEGSDQELSGFYLLNEGQMGANNSTLDYFDVKTGIYNRNIYAERNPNVIKELGDTGNDLKIYNGRLYAVMNGSHKVEIMTADSAKHIADVDVPNGRFICFDGNYAFVYSSATNPKNWLSSTAPFMWPTQEACTQDMTTRFRLSTLTTLP